MNRVYFQISLDLFKKVGKTYIPAGAKWVMKVDAQKYKDTKLTWTRNKSQALNMSKSQAEEVKALVDNDKRECNIEREVLTVEEYAPVGPTPCSQTMEMLRVTR